MSASQAIDSGEFEETDRSGLVLLHLSNYCGYAAPVVGFCVPIVLWIIMKDKSPEADAHGREVVNWLLSELVYFTVSGLLCMVLIGIPLLMLFSALAIIFPIIGAVKASQGVRWRYPLAIRFF